MIPAADRRDESQVDRETQRSDDMDLLLEKADQVRRALDELSSLRAAALESARHDADEMRAQAAAEVRDVVTEANDKARVTVEQAHHTAADMIRSVRREMEQLIATVTKQKSALDSTLAALDKLDHVPVTSPSSEPARVLNEDLYPREAALRPSGETAPDAAEDGPPRRDASSDEARIEAYGPLDFEQTDGS